MAIINRTKRDESLTILTVSGVLNCEDVLHALEDFYKYDVTPNLLWDFTDADVSRITQKDIEKIITFAKTKAHLRENGRTGHLVPDDLSFAMSRIYEFISEIEEHSRHHSSFRSLEKAIAWFESIE